MRAVCPRELFCAIVGPLFGVVAKFGGLVYGELKVEPGATVEECAAYLVGADIVCIKIGEAFM